MYCPKKKVSHGFYFVKLFTSLKGNFCLYSIFIDTHKDETVHMRKKEILLEVMRQW